MVWKSILFWIPMPIIGVVNGIIREIGYRRFVSELTAHQISTFTGFGLFGCYVWFISGKWRIESSGQTLLIGLIWLTLTIAFEFLFGHYIMKNPWSNLFHDYNLLKGRLWVLVPIWITIAPYVMYRLRS